MKKNAIKLSVLAGLLACTGLSPAFANSRVGVSSAVNNQSTLARGPVERTIVVGDDINHQDKIITSSNGLTQVLFVDGSTFTVGSNSRVVIDEFVYNPSSGSGALVSEVTRGALRFVGGKLSKGSKPVQFKTPVGILGVRGGISEIDLSPECQPGQECPIMIASFVFGDELTLTQNNGKKRRVYQAGHAIVVYKDGRTKIVPLRSLKRGNVQKRLAGDPGQNGGAAVIPTNQNVVDSGIPRNNSSRPAVSLRPRLRPEVVATALAPSADIPGFGRLTLDLGETIYEQAQNDFVRNEIEQDETDPDDPLDVNLTGVYGTPPEYTTHNGVVTTTDAYAMNVVQPVSSTTLPVTLTENSEGDPTAVNIGDLTFAFPTEEGETEIDPTTSDDYDVDVTGGTILRGPGGFALYYLALEDIETADPSSLYVVVGTPTPRDVFYPDEPDSRPAELRTYTLGTDYTRQNLDIVSDVPLLTLSAAEAFGNAFLQAAAETPFYVIERADVTPNAKTLYGALRIEGQGAAQRSMIVSDAGLVFASLITTGEDALGIGGTRRGSYRLSSNSESVFMRGGTGSTIIENPDMFTAMAGPNGEAFVYSSSIDTGLARNYAGGDVEFIDVTLDDPINTPTDPLQYGSAMVPTFLSNTELLSTYERSSSTVWGYAAGMLESADGTIAPFRSTNSTDLVMVFDENSATLGGWLKTADTTGAVDQVDGFQYTFGFDVTGEFDGASGSRSAYLDQDRFAANSTGPSDGQGGNTTLLFLSDGTSVQHQPTTSADPKDPGTYVVSSGLAPQPELFAAADVTPCNCDYMNWGWWGTQTQFIDSALDGGSRTDFVHLGTWATADIPTASELPTTGTGSYEGHAIGSVAANVDGTVAQYVAVGDLTMSYDFGNRSGSLAIDNFDGRSFSGAMTGSDGINRFGGSLSGSGVTGQAAGSFARGPLGPAQGVLGSFNVGNAGYSATGTFLGTSN